MISSAAWVATTPWQVDSGNDKFVVDSLADKVVEAAGAGTDSVISPLDHTLAANVENLTLVGEAAINGTGNTLDNRIFGNESNNVLKGDIGNDILTGHGGNDRLVGSVGNDTLTGGAGSDVFEYVTASAFSGSAFGNDFITDFNRTEGDKIMLGKTTYGLAGTIGSALASTEFRSVLNEGLVAGSTARIVHSQSTGNLYYNANGATAGGDIWFATTQTVGVPMLNTDFAVG